MDFRICGGFRTVIIIAVLGLKLDAQVPSATTILNLTEHEQSQFVVESIESGFPESRADQMTMLILNRSAVVVPLIETALRLSLIHI